MEQDDQQPLEAIVQSPTPPQSSSISTKRKLKRFKSDSAPLPATPPPPSSSSSFLSPSTSIPPQQDAFDEALPSTPPLLNEETEQDTTNTPSIETTRRILKITKTPKPKEPPKKENNVESAASFVASSVIVQAGTMRPDGTMRKEVKIRAKQVPKISLSSPEKPKKKQVKRIRPNTNFLTRLVKSSERHNSSLSSQEDSEFDYVTVESDGNTSEEAYEIDYDENDDNENDNEDEVINGDGDDISDETKNNVSNIIETAAREVRKERRFIMNQVTRMRQKEGIILINNLAKLYGLHVSIAEEGESNGKMKKEEKVKPSPASRIVKSVGMIGYNCD